MPSTYYDSAYSAAQIEAAIQAVTTIQSAGNNGKIVTVQNGLLTATSLEDLIEDADNMEF